MSKVTVLRGTEKPSITSKTPITCKKCGNMIEAVYMTYKNNSAKIRKLSKYEYEIIATGEIKEFVHNDNRSDDLNSVSVSLRRLKDYINTNVTKPRNCKWITLTYAENMQDTKQLYKDVDKFIKRFRYKYGEFEYIMSVEPQERGAWHVHLIMIFSSKAPFIANEDMAAVWQHGFTKTQKLANVDNVGAYLTAYLTNLELQDNEDAPKGCKVITKEVDGVEKRFAKGARLPLYPSGINIYRISRGIKPPEIIQMREEDFQEVVKNYEKTYERCVTLFFEDEETEPLDIYYRYYKIKTKQGQEMMQETQGQAHY